MTQRICSSVARCPLPVSRFPLPVALSSALSLGPLLSARLSCLSVHLLLRRAREEGEAFDGPSALLVGKPRDERLDARRIEDRARLAHAHAGAREPHVHAAAILGVAQPDDVAFALQAID